MTETERHEYESRTLAGQMDRFRSACRLLWNQISAAVSDALLGGPTKGAPGG